MHGHIAIKWCDALRSGDYAQIADRLCVENDVKHEIGEPTDRCFCGLGVLCELYAKEHPEAEWQRSGFARPSETGEKRFSYSFVPDRNEPRGNSQAQLPEKVRVWAGMKTPTGRFDDIVLRCNTEDGETLCQTVTELNDAANLPFPEMADIIEQHWEEL